LHSLDKQPEHVSADKSHSAACSGNAIALPYDAFQKYCQVSSMTDAQEIESTLTDRYQTTVPDPVRRALKLRKRDKIRYIVREGEVVIARATAEEDDDPVVGKFLQFLAYDMQQHPERIRPVPASLVKRARALTKRVKIDLDAPLDDE
jgi:antitoxin PrlF